MSPCPEGFLLGKELALSVGERTDEFERRPQERRNNGMMADRTRVSPPTKRLSDSVTVASHGEQIGGDMTESSPTSNEALLFQPEWCRVILASIGDAVITTDINGGVTFLNLVR